MNRLEVTLDPAHGVAIVALNSGKVNALDPVVVDELRRTLRDLTADDTVTGVVLTGRGSFFSFGFDVPALYSCTRLDFTQYLRRFTDLYLSLFSFEKPIVAALNGHAVAGGCMLALGCDQRLMTGGHAKISLNEITFGAGLFAGAVEMLRYWVGSGGAERIALTGDMLDADQARAVGLVDRVTEAEELQRAAVDTVRRLAATDLVAYSSIKGLLRGNLVAEIRRAEEASIQAFVEIWYSEGTRHRLQKIVVR